MRAFGHIDSIYREDDFRIRMESPSFASEYKRDIATSIYDQGSLPSCVSCSIQEIHSQYLRQSGDAGWEKRVLSNEYVFYKRADKSLEGMTPREGFEILRNEKKIKEFSRISNVEMIKFAIMSLGGALIAMRARSEGEEFWNGDQNLGGHAVAAISYDENSLYFKNSWGYEYGDSGIGKISLDDARRCILEAWTILS